MSDAARPAHSNYRWVICALLFFATTINYVDRTVFGVLESTLQKEIGWTATQYGDINAAFSLAYGIGFLFAGWVIDRLGTRLGYTLYLVVWSIAAAAHAFAGTVQQLHDRAVCAGLGESGNFPAAIKTVAEWFPRAERALATGIFNAGTNVGAIISPLVVPVIALQLRLAGGVRRHRPGGPGLGLLLVAAVPAAAGASAGVGSRAGLHRKRSYAARRCKVPWRLLLTLQADVGVCHRQVPDRSHLVVLAVLAAAVS